MTLAGQFNMIGKGFTHFVCDGNRPLAQISATAGETVEQTEIH
ncbi:hypothetical protein [Erwinia sp. E_sp_B04_7]